MFYTQRQSESEKFIVEIIARLTAYDSREPTLG